LLREASAEELHGEVRQEGAAEGEAGDARAKRGKLRSGRSGKRVTSRKQAIAIGLSEARRAGGKVPRKRGGSRKRKGGRKRSRKSS